MDVDFILGTRERESLFLRGRGRVYFSRIKKGEGQGKEKCHAKSMMSKEAHERLNRDTQHVPLRKNTEEKVRGKELKTVWGDANDNIVVYFQPNKKRRRPRKRKMSR